MKPENIEIITENNRYSISSLSTVVAKHENLDEILNFLYVRQKLKLYQSKMTNVNGSDFVKPLTTILHR